MKCFEIEFNNALSLGVSEGSHAVQWRAFVIKMQVVLWEKNATCKTLRCLDDRAVYSATKTVGLIFHRAKNNGFA